MIRLEKINKHFGLTKALTDINLNLTRGKCVGLIGPNACGKTTLIKSVLGMVIPTSGHIYVEGQNIQGQVEYKSKVGYMPQIGRYPQNMTIQQVINMITDLRNFNGQWDDELYHLFGMEKMQNKRMGTLSGGTTQKISAVLAFMFNPPILILDEPTAGLDPISSEILKSKIIQEKDKGKLILISSHLLSEMDDMVSDIIFMQESVVVFYKSFDELRQVTGEEKLSKAIHQLVKESQYAGYN